MWGRLLPRVPFSSDAIGMPWEFMGVYIFLQESSEKLFSTSENCEIYGCIWHLFQHKLCPLKPLSPYMLKISFSIFVPRIPNKF